MIFLIFTYSVLSSKLSFQFHLKEVNISNFFSINFPSSKIVSSSTPTCHLFETHQNTNNEILYQAKINWYIYKNNNNTNIIDDKQISIMGQCESDLKAYSALSLNHYYPIFEMSINSAYFLSHSPIHHHDYNLSLVMLENCIFEKLIPKDIVLYSSGKCFKLFNDFSSLTDEILLSFLIIFIFLFVLRIFYGFLSTNIKDKYGSFFFFCSKDYSFLTFPSSHIPIFQLKDIFSLIKNTNEKNPVFTKIISVERLPQKTHFVLITTQLINSGIVMVFYWHEEYRERSHFTELVIDECSVLVDDSDTPAKVPLRLKINEDGYPNLYLSFKIDDVYCNIRVFSESQNSLPFGFYSLNSLYFDIIHTSLFYNTVSIKPCYKSVLSFLQSIQEALDYVVLGVFKIKYDVIMPYYLYDKTGELNDFIYKFIKEIPLLNLSMDSIKKETIGPYKFGGNRFLVGSQQYIVLIVNYADRLILRYSEIRFHFLISMTVALNHSVLSKDNEMSSFERLLSLFHKTGKFCFLESIENPLNLVRTRGCLFGKKIDKSSIELFARSCIIPASELSLYSDPSKIVQAGFPLQFGINDYRLITLSSSFFFDPTHDLHCYNFVAEDVTDLLNDQMNHFSIGLEALAVSSLIGLHKLTPNYEIIQPDKISQELGYENLLKSLEPIILQNDLPLIKKMQRTIIRIRDAKGFLQSYFAFMTSFESTIFLFSADIIKSLPSFPKQNNYISNDFCMVVIDLEMGNSILHTTSHFLMRNNSHRNENFVCNDNILQPLDCDVDEEALELLNAIINNIHKDDLDLFLNMLKLVRRKKQYSMSNFIRIITPYDYHWHIVVITERENETLSIFIINFDLILRKSLRISDTLQIYDSSFYMKVLQFTFENSQQPLRIFSSMPISTNVITINWITLKHNVAEVDQEKAIDCFNRAIKDGKPFSILLRCKFETEKLILFRGQKYDDSDDIFGIMIDAGSIMETAEYQEKKLSVLHQNLAIVQEAHEFTKRVIRDFTKVLNLFDELIKNNINNPSKEDYIQTMKEVYNMINHSY